MSDSIRFIDVARLGTPGFVSPLVKASVPGRTEHFTSESRYVRLTPEVSRQAPAEAEVAFAEAGPRERVFFDAAHSRAAVVTCGGLCPGLNNVIRSLYLELHRNYGVPSVLGVRYGYLGLNAAEGDPPVELSMELVRNIHDDGGTVLGSSRGPQPPQVMVDWLVAHGVNMLFCVGGDGTQRGAHALHEEIARRQLSIAVIGIPKTIDNDLLYCDRSFGFTTAVAMAEQVIQGAHVEAIGARNGIGLVKLMGRESGFITAAAAVASQEVNFALVPEQAFALEGEGGLLPLLRQRIVDRQHAVIVVAEGAGQHLFARSAGDRDASGNVKFQDIGLLLRQEIGRYFAQHGPEITLKYIDPSYLVRSVPANSEDDFLCDQFARHAAHAAMAGFTDCMIGLLHGRFVHVPIGMATERKRQLDLQGHLWRAVLSATGQKL